MTDREKELATKGGDSMLKKIDELILLLTERNIKSIKALENSKGTLTDPRIREIKALTELLAARALMKRSLFTSQPLSAAAPLKGSLKCAAGALGER
ncbi:MAG: hypothetical protein LUC92_03795 [Clostridiales bacterium]|nr:hypothetical protein [Clostridiales bacterium]